MIATMDHKVVHSDPEIMHGTSVFVGTRVPGQNLWDYLEGGMASKVFLRVSPALDGNRRLG